MLTENDNEFFVDGKRVQIHEGSYGSKFVEGQKTAPNMAPFYFN